MSLHRLLGLGCVLAAATLGVAACGDDDDGAGGGGGGGAGGGGQANTASFDLEMGVLVPLTGDLAVFGPPGRKAAQLAIKEAEAAAREAGAQINVTAEIGDTETNAQAAQQAARQLISGGAGCLIGPWASDEVKPTGTSVAGRQRVPLITPSATGTEITDLQDNDFVFRTPPSDDLQVGALADAVAQELGATNGTISLAARNDAYGEGFAEDFKEAWEEKGGRVTGPVLYDPEQASYNSEARRIASGNPDAYVIIDFPETYAKMGAALVRSGNFDTGKLFVTDGLASDAGIPEGIPRQALAGARGTRPGPGTETATAKAFAQLYQQGGGPGRGTFDAHNFDATLTCFLAAVAAGSAEPREIQENLQRISAPGGRKFTFEQLGDAVKALRAGQDIDFEGVTGPIDWDENGDVQAATYEIYTYRDDGKFAVTGTVAARGEGGE